MVLGVEDPGAIGRLVRITLVGEGWGDLPRLTSPQELVTAKRALPCSVVSVVNNWPYFLVGNARLSDYLTDAATQRLLSRLTQ